MYHCRVGLQGLFKARRWHDHLHWPSQVRLRNLNDNAAALKQLSWAAGSSQSLARLVEAYQNHGHKVADTNPLQSLKTLECEDLNPSMYNLKMSDFTDNERGVTVCDAINDLRKVYCGQLSVETMVVESIEERMWLHDCFTDVLSQPIDAEVRKEISRSLVESQTFDNFLATKFPTLKRYSCEGAESMLAFMERCIADLASSGVRQVVIGMPHRGRNNILVGMLRYPVEMMLRKIKGLSEFPPEAHSVATGDVLSHLGTSTDLDVGGSSVHVNLLQNSSFLEGVNPVAMGKCRARQQALGRDGAACLLVHGDASVTGQGVVMECMNMSKLPHFSVGGTIHLIVNNQIGFTTTSELGRSSRYASDIGKMIGCPVLHVNGDNPEMVWRAARIAAQYRAKYESDIIVDMLCFRRWGHNEMDNPTFTQPLMYDVIHNRPSVPDAYTSQLVEEEVVDEEEVESWKKDRLASFNVAFKQCDQHTPSASYLSPKSSWADMTIPSNDHVTSWATGCQAEELRCIGAKSLEVSEEFQVHESLKKSHVEARMKRIEMNLDVDWSLAETFAFGSLLNQGFDVRLCGQDSGRGTFSHRHASLTCQESGRLHQPLNHIREGQKTTIEIVSSLLSEEAVLGFEYGISIESPKRLVVWEAQFGDFFTTAQVMVDTLIMSGEAKWMYQSALTLLLPHGYDGAGPEHSSARIERFLQSTNSSETEIDGDNVNASVCHPTTAAQIFHLLRRQMIRDFRKPLIVASPKLLLRHQGASSPLCDFTEGTRFHPVIDDVAIKEPQRVKKVIFCTGKHYYALDQERRKRNALEDVAVVRVEELCPFPASLLIEAVARYPRAETHVWAQEEPRNMGAWGFVSPRFANIVGMKLKYAGRAPLAAPAVGIGTLHLEQAKRAIDDAFM